MSDDLDNLAEKIRKAKGEDKASLAKQRAEAADKNSKQGMQAGIELVGAILLCTALGYGIDNWLGTKPAFLLIFFFLGTCTGFYNVYRISNNMGTAVGNKQPEKTSQNDLQGD